MPRITAELAGGLNRCAFLDMVTQSEIGAALLLKSDDGYNVIVGSTPEAPILFPCLVDGSINYSVHPHMYQKKQNSTAAGRYQELWANWVSYSASLGLADFSPVSQDRMALQQIKEAGAFALIDAGSIAKAIAACAHLWASFAGAGYGQHEQKLANLIQWYETAGGGLNVDR